MHSAVSFVRVAGKPSNVNQKQTPFNETRLVMPFRSLERRGDSVQDYTRGPDALGFQKLPAFQGFY